MGGFYFSSIKLTGLRIPPKLLSFAMLHLVQGQSAISWRIDLQWLLKTIKPINHGSSAVPKAHD
jgi:hypothetical protein